ncbi:hypothetical protein HAX54_031816, partial [Datura stramonium]|nr:hypothetical protein [Datura stramonium]
MANTRDEIFLGIKMMNLKHCHARGSHTLAQGQVRRDTPSAQQNACSSSISRQGQARGTPTLAHRHARRNSKSRVMEGMTQLPSRCVGMCQVALIAAMRQGFQNGKKVDFLLQ